MSIEMTERLQRYITLINAWNGFKPGADELGMLLACLWNLAFTPLQEDRPA